MSYSIGEVAKKLNLTIYTLRYYDKEGLMPFVERTPNGSRVFKESDLEALKLIECLKTTGMSIKDIKQFTNWSTQGDISLQQRYDVFIERKTAVESQMEELKKTMEVIQHKCRYYKTALEAGTENIHTNKKTDNFVS